MIKTSFRRLLMLMALVGMLLMMTTITASALVQYR